MDISLQNTVAFLPTHPVLILPPHFESIENALEAHGYERTRYLLETLIEYAQSNGARLPFNTNTPFVNTILPSQQPQYPGDRDIERNIKSIIRRDFKQ